MKMPEQLERMMFGFIESQVLFVCDEIQLFDFLAENGAATCTTISTALHLPASSLERILICAVCAQFLEKKNGHYNIKDHLAPFLVRKSPDYCGDKYTHYYKMSYQIFNYLLDALKENKPQWGKLDHPNLNSIYTDAIYTNALATKQFLETMWASGFNDSIELCQKFSFLGYKQLIDLGGATGSFAIAALLQNSELHAAVMDYAQVKPYAEEKFIEYGMQGRAHFHIGDMFNDAFPKGDIYAIGYVLSDWPEDSCLHLIQKVYSYLPPNGLIIILEKFFNEDKTGPYLTAMLNLTMLLEMNGTHRTAAEYVSWLEQAGFAEYQTVYSSGEKNMIIAKKR